MIFIVYLSLILKAIHNKDYSVVKTFSASTIFGAFLCEKNDVQFVEHRL